MKPRAAMTKHRHPTKVGSPIFETRIEAVAEIAFKTLRIETRQRDGCKAKPEAKNDFDLIGPLCL
jgi:hypothetical protein